MMFSRRFRSVSAAALVAVVLVVGGCSGPQTASRPQWVDAPPPHSGSHLYFTGGSGWRSSESEARQAAMHSAASHITTYFGARVSSTATDIQTAANGADSGVYSIRTTFVGTDVTLRGIEQRGTWCARVSAGFDCTVLVSYPRQEYEKAKAEIAAAERLYIKRMQEGALRALDLYRHAVGCESSKDFDGAMASLTQASGIIKGFEMAVDLPDAKLANTDLLLREISQTLPRVGAMLKDSANWMAVRVVATLDRNRSDSHERTVFSSVSDAAQRHAFKTREAAMSESDATRCLAGDADAVRTAAGAARYLLVVQLDSEFSSEVSGQYFSQAQGRWALLESSSGQVIASGNLDRKKGYGVSRESACAMGLEMLSKQACGELARAFEYAKQGRR